MKTNSLKTILQGFVGHFFPSILKKNIKTILAVLTGGLFSSAVIASGFNFREFQTKIGEDIFNLHTILMVVIIIVFVGVFYFMFHSLILHRKSRIADGYKPSNFHENVWVEIAWTVIPLVLLVIIAVPATFSMLEMRDNNDSDFSVLVTGYQFKWGYEYLDGPGKGIKYLSNMSTSLEEIANKQAKAEHYLLEVDNPLVIPAGKKTKFLITSKDVLHAFFVPELAMQQTAVPGFIREFSVNPLKPGTYRGQCSELCGPGHSYMPVVIKVLPMDEYKEWAEKKIASAPKFDAGKNFTMDELVESGESAYATYCKNCHRSEGEGLAPVFPALANSVFVAGDKNTVLDTITNGRPGTAMGAYGTQISEVEIAAITTFIRNSFGNSTGDIVQPSEVTAIKKK